MTVTVQEHFKECEKEAKLKPFAKAALAAKNERIDPVAQAKEEAQRWLRDSVNSLAEQVEGFEVSPCRGSSTHGAALPADVSSVIPAENSAEASMPSICSKLGRSTDL